MIDFRRKPVGNVECMCMCKVAVMLFDTLKLIVNVINLAICVRVMKPWSHTVYILDGEDIIAT